MYFKINPIQKDKYVNMGMINISASFFLEPGDADYDKYIAEHFVTVPVIPKEGYPGKMTEGLISNPIDQEDYNNWIASLPTIQKLNPFCTHSIQFEANATEEEILWCFEWALGLTHINYHYDDLHCQKGTGAKTVNQDIGYLKRREEYKTLDSAKMAKIANVEAKINILKDIDFTKVVTVAKYKVK